jgi:hypothetical protein
MWIIFVLNMKTMYVIIKNQTRRLSLTSVVFQVDADVEAISVA